jgi:hypothetical protein
MGKIDWKNKYVKRKKKHNGTVSVRDPLRHARLPESVICHAMIATFLCYTLLHCSSE